MDAAFVSAELLEIWKYFGTLIAGWLRRRLLLMAAIFATSFSDFWCGVVFGDEIRVERFGDANFFEWFRIGIGRVFRRIDLILVVL